MARPSKFNRDEAIDHVMNEIWRNGYGASSVKSLSESLGITRSSFYNAFESREALFREVLQRYYDQSPDKALAQADVNTPILPLISATLRAACKARGTDPDSKGCLVVNCVAELSNTDPVLGPEMKRAVQDNLALFEQLLTWARERGEIPADADIKAKALALQNLLIGLNAMCKAVTDEKDLWQAVRTTLEGLALYVPVEEVS